MSEEVEKFKYQILQASPKALAKCDADQIGRGERIEGPPNSKYPFRELLTGDCFVINFGDMEPSTLANLRSLASSYGRKLCRKFVVIIHKEYNCVEVARIS